MADSFTVPALPAYPYAPASGGGEMAAPAQNAFQKAVDPTPLLSSFVTPNSPSKTFVRKSAEDVAALGAAPAALLAHPVQAVKNLPGATVESFKQTFDPRFYDEHPVLATINTLANLSIVGGLALDATGIGAVAGIPLSLFGLAVRGATSLVEKEAVDLAVQTGANAAKTAVLTALPKSALHTMTASILKTGTSEAAIDFAKVQLVKRGVEEGAAATIAERVTGEVAAGLQKYRPAISIANKAAHPLDTMFGAAGKIISPTVAKIFGNPSKSGVATVFGVEHVSKNPVLYSSIEDYAARYAGERGWKPGVESNVRAMNEWSQTNPLWAAADAEGRAQIHQNFIKADSAAVQASRITGDPVVAVKFISPNDYNAMLATIKDAPAEEFSQTLHPDGTRTMPPIFKALTDIHGSDIGNFSGVLKQAFDKTPTKEGLIAALNSIRKGFVLSYPKESEVYQLLEQASKDTGYNFSIPPSSKPISHTAEAEAAHPLADAGTHGVSPNTLTAEEASSKLVAAKTKLGQYFEKFGLSPNGVAEGSMLAAFADNFARGIVENLGAKFPDGIKIPDRLNTTTGVAVTYRTVPLNRIYSFLNKITGGMSMQNISYDFLTKDLKIGKAEAQGIVDTARTSLAGIPFSKTGLLEGVANAIKAKVPLYNSMIKTTINSRYNISPFFGLRIISKMNVLGMMDAGKGGMYVGTGIENTLRKVPYLREVMAPEVVEGDIVAMSREIFDQMENKPFDSSSNPEVLSLSQRLGVKKSQQASNLLLRGIGYDTETHAVRMAGAIADKSGLTLQEALGFKMVKGMKVYDHPVVFNAIRDAEQAVFHYQAGFLTSPLVRTLNVIWYPFRFESKVVNQTAKFLSTLSPAKKMAVMSSVTHFANFIQTPEGKKWKKDNESVLHNVLDYVLPYAEIGNTISSVMKGQLFDGNTGLIGGIPFGMVVNILNDLGIANTDYGARNPDTGKPYTKTVPKSLMSKAAAVTALNDVLTFMFPSIPTTKLLGGGEPFSRWLDDTLIRAEAGGTSEGAREIHHGMKKVKPDYQRFHPLKAVEEFFTPQVAEASVIKPEERLKVASTTVDKVGALHTLQGGTQVRELAPSTKTAIAAAYKRFPDLPKGILEATYGQESSFGTNRANEATDQGAYGWMVGFTRNTYRDIQAKAAEGDVRYQKLLKQLDFSSKGGALRSAAAYLDFRSKSWNADGSQNTSTGRLLDPVRLYSSRYNGGGAGKDFNHEKFADLVAYYSQA